jgi:hypothetical protein
MKQLQQSAHEKFGWYVHIAVLAGGDVLKVDAVTKLNVHEALHMLGLKNYLQ